MLVVERVRVGLAGIALGMVAITAPLSVAADDAAGPNTGKLSLDASVDWTTAYFFRGILQENQGLILQPAAEVGVNLFEGEGTVNSVDGFFGIWNSIHGENTGAAPTATVDSWYESDLYFGASATIFDNITVCAAFTAYTSPSDAFSTIHEISVFACYDDSAMWDDTTWFVGFAPSATIAFETHNSAFGPEEGIYLELGIAPTFMFFADGTFKDLSIATPVTVGLSIDDYYETATDNDTFGFVSAGLVGSMPLPVPADYGAWTLSAGVQVLFLGDNLEALNNGDDTEIIGTLSLGISY